MPMHVRTLHPDETKPLRHKVLWPHIENTEDCVIDIDHRDDAIHLGAIEDGKIIGICSLFEMTSPKISDAKQYRLRAMATDPEVRGSGAGAAIVKEALDIVRTKGYDVLWCDARKVALGFYERMGFDRIDEWYEVRNIGPHQFMYFRFSQK
jgi:predicted GNAT family N-acyltransferase